MSAKQTRLPRGIFRVCAPHAHPTIPLEPRCPAPRRPANSTEPLPGRIDRTAFPTFPDLTHDTLLVSTARTLRLSTMRTRAIALAIKRKERVLSCYRGTIVLFSIRQSGLLTSGSLGPHFLFGSPGSGGAPPGSIRVGGISTPSEGVAGGSPCGTISVSSIKGSLSIFGSKKSAI